MWVGGGLTGYELLDATCGERLERWGDYILIRPDPQVIWRTPRRHKGWQSADASYTRDSGGGGAWSRNSLPGSWNVSWDDLTFKVRPTGFKHMGLFPEQSANWEALRGIIRSADRPLNILNLFAYTGAATVVCAKTGGHRVTVTHVDAAKGMVAWAKENAAINNAGARWIVDDCNAFAERELRRGSLYDGIIMDPPSYGRGTGKQVWKLEDDLYAFIRKTAGLLGPGARFFFLNAYTTGLAPSVLRILLETALVPRFGGRVEADELGLRAEAAGMVIPSGATGRWMR